LLKRGKGEELWEGETILASFRERAIGSSTAREGISGRSDNKPLPGGPLEREKGGGRPHCLRDRNAPCIFRKEKELRHLKNSTPSPSAGN